MPSDHGRKHAILERKAVVTPRAFGFDDDRAIAAFYWR
jgi:hypothetical protein